MHGSGSRVQNPRNVKMKNKRGEMIDSMDIRGKNKGNILCEFCGNKFDNLHEIAKCMRYTNSQTLCTKKQII
jgi:hypothetical protein